MAATTEAFPSMMSALRWGTLRHGLAGQTRFFSGISVQVSNVVDIKMPLLQYLPLD